MALTIGASLRPYLGAVSLLPFTGIFLNFAAMNEMVIRWIAANARTQASLDAVPTLRKLNIAVAVCGILIIPIGVLVPSI